MKDSGIFRKINTIETNMITKSLDSISAKISSELDRLKMVLYISVERSTTKKDFPKIYLINNEQVKLIRKIDVKNKIHAAGLYFGFIKKGTFYLSLEGAEYLYRQELLPGIQRLQVNELGEKFSVIHGDIPFHATVVGIVHRNFILVLHRIHFINGSDVCESEAFDSRIVECGRIIIPE